MKYPTKEEILRLPRPVFKTGVMNAVSEWKKGYYKGWDEKEEKSRVVFLNVLANKISRLHGLMGIHVGFGATDTYDPHTISISLTKPSILTLLHELAHHLFGASEQTACRWSVWLYQLRFRKDFNKLVWKEHMLIKPHSQRKTESLPQPKA